MRAETDKVICSGGRRGKQFTYALFDERVPKTRAWTRDQALAEFATRFFTGHGPATVRDFTLWSGLTATDAKHGLEMAKPKLLSKELNGKTFWFAKDMQAAPPIKDVVHLIPAYDEYFSDYHDYDALSLDHSHQQAVANAAAQTILVDGQIAGTWKRVLAKGAVAIEPKLFAPLTPVQTKHLKAATDRYGSFVDLPIRT